MIFQIFILNSGQPMSIRASGEIISFPDDIISKEELTLFGSQICHHRFTKP